MCVSHIHIAMILGYRPYQLMGCPMTSGFLTSPKRLLVGFPLRAQGDLLLKTPRAPHLHRSNGRRDLGGSAEMDSSTTWIDFVELLART